jgi:hypothetical protein
MLFAHTCGLLFSSSGAPFLCGLLFAAHPIHVEAVAGTVGR